MVSNPVVRAVDLGFGNAKFVTQHIRGAEIECSAFPSLAPLASELNVSGGILERANTVIVEVNGKRYEVGPGVGVARNGCDHRILHGEFIRTPEYQALMRGILHYMNAPTIDLLVVGLPMGQAAKRGGELERLLVGHHPLPDGRSVEVRQVTSVAQPIGGFMQYLLGGLAPPIVRRQVNLVIDVGFFTVDWLLCEGMRPISQRCGHTEGGVSALLKHIAARISEEHDINYTDYTALDRSLRTGYFDLFGASIPIAKYVPAASPVLDKALAGLANSVGNGHDIHNIVVVGGGADYYMPAIKERFPKHPVFVVPHPMFANVRGFQLSGEYQLATKVA